MFTLVYYQNLVVLWFDMTYSPQKLIYQSFDVQLLMLFWGAPGSLSDTGSSSSWAMRARPMVDYELVT